MNQTEERAIAGSYLREIAGHTEPKDPELARQYKEAAAALGVRVISRQPQSTASGETFQPVNE